jgi:recombination protein U
MNIKGNLGLYAEEIINRTCEYYKDKKIAHIEKREIPMKIIKQINESVVLCKLMSKSYVDYFGSYMGKHLEFEVKQTSEQNFNTSIIKSHQ